MVDCAPSDSRYDHATGSAGADAGHFALLGHDLRAAVSDILGGLRLIDPTGLDAGTQVQLERVRVAGEGLARLLEQELAMIAGAPSATGILPRNLHLGRLLNDLRMRWEGRALQKGLVFELELGDDLPVLLNVERLALERAMSNLLGNAVKYTDQGRVQLSVMRSPVGGLDLSVRDQGPGFTAAALAAVQAQTGRPETHGKPGHGLGIQIAENMVAGMGGVLRLANDPAGGAVACVSLPANVCVVRPSDANPHDDGPLPDLSQIRVLLGDDSQTNQLLISALLVSLGAEVELASDGVEVLNWLDRERFDIVLLDIEMPRLSGLDVLRGLRAQGGPVAQTPVLAITAYVLRANREAIYAAGADGILAKPVTSHEDLAHSIARVLARRSPVPQAVALDGQLIDLARFDHLMAIAGPVTAPELLARLQSDLRSVERGLIAALAGLSDNPEALGVVRAQTHVLLALAGSVGAQRLYNLAEALNTAAHQHNLAVVRSLGQVTLLQLDYLITFISGRAAR